MTTLIVVGWLPDAIIGVATCGSEGETLPLSLFDGVTVDVDKGAELPEPFVEDFAVVLRTNRLLESL